MKLIHYFIILLLNFQLSYQKMLIMFSSKLFDLVDCLNIQHFSGF